MHAPAHLASRRAWVVGCSCSLMLAPGIVRGEDPRPVPPPRVTPGLVLESSRGAGADAGPKLEPIGGGRLRHRARGFTAIIDADGSVEFRDVLVESKTSLLGFDLRGRRSPQAPGPKDSFEERALYPAGGPTAPTMVGAGGSFGGLAAALIGALRRKTPGARASPSHRHTGAKAAFLQETEAVRMRMAHRWLKSRLAAQLDALVAEILALWRDTSVPLAERRRRIFAVWDECDEGDRPPTTALDEIRIEAATQARTRIEALVRLLAPAGSPQQFTPAELARLNARRKSRRAFAPYTVP